MIIFLGVCLHCLIDMLMMFFTERYYAKKCGYNCSVCKNWKCFYHTCKKKREGN